MAVPFEANLSRSSSSLSETSTADAHYGSHLPLADPNSKYHSRGDFLPLAAMRAAVDQKGLDVRGLELDSDIADYFVIVSGTSERHVKGIADRIKKSLEEAGEPVHRINGYEQGEWVLLDYGDLVVHVFYEPMRQHYGLDDLWSDKSILIEPDEELQKNMRKLRTGIAW